MLRFTLKNYWTESHLFTRRILIATLFIFVLLAILLGRLLYLQILEHQHYTTLSDQNQLGLIPIEANRGLIYDRNGILLAENIPIFSLDAVPERTSNFKQSLKAIEKFISITPEDLKQFYREAKRQRTLEGVPLKMNLTEEEVARFYLNQYQFPGFHITGRLMRYYPQGETLVSALGYVSRINEQELSEVDAINYAGTSYIGKLGLEKSYEDTLHGQVGYQQVETDANGHILRILKRVPPKSGANLYLSLDSKLQKAAEEALGKEQGAVVAIEPATGQVLAFVSNPHYDPNPFVRGITPSEYKALQSNPERPLYNRALRGLYASGSIIKPFLGLQILDKGITTPNATISDPGWFELPHSSHRFNDWKKGGHGIVDFHKAIVQSCDIYFFTMGARMGIALLHDIQDRFGLGHTTGLDVEEELAGVAASPEWKRKALKKDWYPGDTVNASIGQGYTLVTPLQMAVATATLANRGIRYEPRFVAKIQTSDGTITPIKPTPLKPVTLVHEGFWDNVIDAMEDVVTEGTARAISQHLTYTIAGKTGTAQVFRPKSYGINDSDAIPKKYRSHSWFIAFAPVDKPKIALAVIVENHPHTAHLIARKVLDYYLLPDHGIQKDEDDKESEEESGPSD